MIGLSLGPQYEGGNIMASKTKDPGLISSAGSNTPKNNITYANEVVATIAGIAANEVEGIAGMTAVNSSILGKNRNLTKGVKVEIGVEEVSVDLYVTVEYGTPIQKACQDAQESVRKTIESMTGLHVVRVDVHVQSVSFEKENLAIQASKDNNVLEAGNAQHSDDGYATDGVTADAAENGIPENKSDEK